MFLLQDGLVLACCWCCSRLGPDTASVIPATGGGGGGWSSCDVEVGVALGSLKLSELLWHIVWCWWCYCRSCGSCDVEVGVALGS